MATHARTTTARHILKARCTALSRNLSRASGPEFFSIRVFEFSIAETTERTGAAILVVDHLNKRSGIAAIQRGSGSIGFNAAARSVLLVSKHPQEPETFVLASVKSNLGPPPPSWAYRMVEAENKAVKLEWLGDCPYDADELVAGAFDLVNNRKLAAAMEFLRNRLSQASGLSKVVEKEAAAQGISGRTLTRARKELGVISKPTGLQGEWVLSLPLRQVLTSG